MRPKLLARGVVTEHELDEIDRAAREHFNDPDTLVMPNLLFLVWGREPSMVRGAGVGASTRSAEQKR